MRTAKALLVLIAAVLLAAGLATQGEAYHSGGVAECEGCHTMHNSFEGATTSTGLPQFQAGPYLLKGSDQSSACLNCHQHAGDTGPNGYHISTADADMPAGIAPLQRTPGGDFGWLKKSYTWIPRTGAAAETSPGERHGHNIVANDYGYVADGKLTVAPGGTYPAASLACSSCHDPHGKYRRDVNGTVATSGLPIKNSGSYNNSADPTAWGSVGVYRILGGIGYQPKSLSGSFAFANDVPDAVAPSTYNRSDNTTQTRVAYGTGMSEWCSNCHTNLHRDSYTSGTSGLTHPAGAGAKLTTAITANYNTYVKSGDLTGTAASSYLNLVPFEEGTTGHALATYTTLKAHALNTDAYLQGPDGTNANVACVSCHRAHASGFDSMLRFGVGNEFITVADASGNAIWPDITANPAQAQGRTAAETQASYYDRAATKFAPYQRDLCNKCHAKD